MTLFADRGPDVTVAEITQAAGVSKGTFYVYFASKAELIAALRESTDRRVPRPDGEGDGRQLARSARRSPSHVRWSASRSTSSPASSTRSSSRRRPTRRTGAAEVVRGFEEFLIDANEKGITDVSRPVLVRRPARRRGELRRPIQPGRRTFDREALVNAIVELQRRAARAMTTFEERSTDEFMFEDRRRHGGLLPPLVAIRHRARRRRRRTRRIGALGSLRARRRRAARRWRRGVHARSTRARSHRRLDGAGADRAAWHGRSARRHRRARPACPCRSG